MRCASVGSRRTVCNCIWSSVALQNRCSHPRQAYLLQQNFGIKMSMSRLKHTTHPAVGSSPSPGPQQFPKFSSTAAANNRSCSMDYPRSLLPAPPASTRSPHQDPDSSCDEHSCSLGSIGQQTLTSKAVTAASVARMEGPRWVVIIPRRGSPSPSPSVWGSMSSKWRRSSHSPADTPLLKMLGSS